MLTRVDSELVWTPRRLAEWLCVGGMSASCVGSPQTIVDHFEEWLDVADVDGFNIARVTNFGTFEDFRDLITPELRRRGLIPEEHEQTAQTFRERVYGHSGLRDDHPGSLFKFGKSLSTVQRTTAPVTLRTQPRNVGLLVTLTAKPETVERLEDWLSEMQAHAEEERGTESWYAFKIDDVTYGIYDTFLTEEGREQHIHGNIVKSLRKEQHDLLAIPPDIRQLDLLAVKSALVPA